jgi:hypothetical protein
MISAPLLRYCKAVQCAFIVELGAKNGLSVKELHNLASKIQGGVGDNSGPVEAVQNAFNQFNWELMDLRTIQWVKDGEPATSDLAIGSCPLLQKYMREAMEGKRWNQIKTLVEEKWAQKHGTIDVDMMAEWMKGKSGLWGTKRLHTKSWVSALSPRLGCTPMDGIWMAGVGAVKFMTSSTASRDAWDRMGLVLPSFGTS